MNTFWTALVTVLVVELTDRTRLIALLLSSRFRAPVALIVGMTAGYLIPLGLAAYGAGFIMQWLPPALVRAAVVGSFVAFGAWLLRGGGEEEEEHKLPSRWERLEKFGPLVLGFVLVFLTEFADKSQIATAALAIRLRPVTAVFLGAVSAQAILNVVYVTAGQWIGRKLPERLIRRVAGWIFIGLGLASCVL